MFCLTLSGRRLGSVFLVKEAIKLLSLFVYLCLFVYIIVHNVMLLFFFAYPFF